MHGHMNYVPDTWRRRPLAFSRADKRLWHRMVPRRNTAVTLAAARTRRRTQPSQAPETAPQPRASSCRCSRFGQAQDKPYGRALLDFAFDPNPASVCFDDFFSQSQPQPAAWPRVSGFCAALIKALKDMRQLIGGDAGPYVGHRNLKDASVVVGVDLCVDDASLGTELQSI